MVRCIGMKCAEPIIDFFWFGSAEQVFGMIHLAVGAYGTTSFGWTFSSFVTFGKAGNTVLVAPLDLKSFYEVPETK